MTAYADTSFFVSVYLSDAHSTAAERLLSSGERVWFTPLHFAEFCHAVAQQVFYKNITLGQAQNAYDEMEDDRALRLWVDLSVPEEAFASCAQLARRHGAKLGVRTLDSLHVACALELKAERFWTFDERQAKLAKAEGLKTS